jgi:hypothetical protein
MNFLKRILAVCVVVACASPVGAQSDWSFTITPSIWAAGLNGSVQIGPLTDEIRVNFSDTYGLAEIGGVIAFEANNGRIGWIVEGGTLEISDGAEPPDIFNETADVTVDHMFWHLAGTYRVRAASPVVDVLLGARYFDVDADVTILSGADVDRQGSTSEDWLDGYFGARVRQDIGEKWWALGYFDAGSGGSRFSWQVALEGGRRFSSAVSGRFGYRMMSTDYQGDPLRYSSMKISGPYVGLQFGW